MNDLDLLADLVAIENDPNLADLRDQLEGVCTEQRALRCARVALRLQRGYTYAEIAQVCGVSHALIGFDVELMRTVLRPATIAA